MEESRNLQRYRDYEAGSTGFEQIGSSTLAAILCPQSRVAPCGSGRGGYLNPTMASENVHVFNDLNFDSEVINSKQTVLVDFTASWCGPCRALAPIIDQVADELGAEAKVGKLDIDEAPVTAGKFGVRGVPTIMIFQNGEKKEQHVGLTTKAKLLELVRS